MKFLFCLLISIMITLNAQADSVVSTPIESSAVVNTIIGNAQDWHLSLDEWNHYQQIMTGSAGKWYPQLTPPEVLGMYADTLSDQNHFAEIAAREQHDKVAREIVFNNAFTEAMHRLYDQEPVIKPFDMSPFNPVNRTIPFRYIESTKLQSGDRLDLFVDVKVPFDFIMLPELLALLNTHPGVMLDIYAVGSSDDAIIQAWAKRNNVPVDLVTKGIITLNHAKDSLKNLHESGEALPYVVLIRYGTSQPVKLPKLI
jgi:integrating conjugative element protein (TIGR03759 family)